MLYFSWSAGHKINEHECEYNNKHPQISKEQKVIISSTDKRRVFYAGADGRLQDVRNDSEFAVTLPVSCNMYLV